MAVFPDRIVLKSSTDDPEDIKAAIRSGSTDAIVRGELVVSVQPAGAQVYTIDQEGRTVNIAVQSIGEMDDVVLSYPVPNSALLSYNESTGKWVASVAPPFDVSGNFIGDLQDVDGTPPTERKFLGWNHLLNTWYPKDITMSMIADVNVIEEAAPVEGDVLKFSGAFWYGDSITYSEVVDAPEGLSDLTLDIDLNDIVGVDAAALSLNDLLAWNGTGWAPVSAPPVSLEGNVLTDIGNVQEGTGGNNAVPVYTASENAFVIKSIEYDMIDDRPVRLGDLENDLSVSDFPNDADYITSTEGYSFGQLSDTFFSDPIQEGHVAIYRSGQWINQFGPPADITYNSIGDFYDTNYYRPVGTPGILTVTGLGTLSFDHPSVGSGYTYTVTHDLEYGTGITAFRDNDLSGSAVYADRSRGVTLRSDVNIVRLTGRPDRVTNQPELRFETGDDGGDRSTGKYVGFKLPLVEDSITYTLPIEDGNVGNVLSTNGDGGMAWIPVVAGVSELNELSDVDLSNPTPSNGDALIYNLGRNKWVPGTIVPDLSTASIDGLSDVDTSTVSPEISQGLVWDGSNWVPGDTNADLSSASINELSDVDTSTSSPAVDQGLVWNGTDWVPGNTSSTVTWNVTATDSARYMISGAGLESPVANPDLYVFRGQRYVFIKDIPNHPFQIENSDGGIFQEGVSGQHPLLASEMSWEVPLSAPDLLYYQCTAHAAMRGTIHVISESPAASLNDLTDVDTLSTPPSQGDVLEWNGTTWEPAPVASSFTGIDQVTESKTTNASGRANFTGIGRCGVLVSVSCTDEAWITLYSTSSARTSDVSRLYSEDPEPGSGVLAEVFASAGGTVTATPGTTYFNAQANPSDSIYAAARNQDGSPVAATSVTIRAFPVASGNDSGMSLNSMKSIAAASSDFSDFQARIAAL